MERKGFTLVELLVVIAIIALLMGILMPALSRARQLAFRATCGTNLSGLGKAMMLYAHDNAGRLPRAGGSQSTWGPVKLWSAPDPRAAFGVAREEQPEPPPVETCRCNLGKGLSSNNTASISSCFYLLVRYAEVTPKSFVCRGDLGTSEFKLSELAPGTVPSTFELTDAWDFGPQAWKHSSYSYHLPFGSAGLKDADEPGLAVAAERNPWLASPAAEAKLFPGVGASLFRPEVAPYQGSSAQARNGNAITHQNDGQNVLFLDTHVRFEKRAHCAIEEDNIYTVSDRPERGSPLGILPAVPSVRVANRVDSVLVHDPPQFSSGFAPASIHGGHGK